MSRFATRARGALLAGSLVATSEVTLAAPPARPVLKWLAQGNAPALQSNWLGSARAGRVLVRFAPGTAIRDSAIMPITETVGVATGTPQILAELQSDVQVELSAPRHTLLDRASTHHFASTARSSFGVDGAGVMVGVVDTGVSLFHPALQNPDGTTRIEWLLSYNLPPLGLHPDLEQLYGCHGTDVQCAVLHRSEIDELAAGNLGVDPPLDTVGHGTHVASTIVSQDSVYGGIAPGAQLVVIQAGGGSGYLGDAEILLGTQFVFDRARDAGMPAVVNLSLGSSFGSHDGASALEEGLAELGRGAGRAIVISSGNEGSVYTLDGRPEPPPFGIHTEAAVLRGGETRISLVPVFDGYETVILYAWLTKSENADLEVAVTSRGGGATEFVPVGSSMVFDQTNLKEAGKFQGEIVHGDDEDPTLGALDERQAVILLAGLMDGGVNRELVFRGEGKVNVWIQSYIQTDAGTLPGSFFLPRARSTGTVTIPATHPDLISVGSTVNRSSWQDYTGQTNLSETPEDALSRFSSSGPNQLGQVKPDILAPGENLIAAMAPEADPRVMGAQSAFSSFGTCADSSVECLVVNDEFAVLSGTSMAAPQVAGAVALLLQRDPSLQMREIRTLLRAGARAPGDGGEPTQWYGAGSLDIEGSLIAQDRMSAEETHAPSAASSRFVQADSYLVPGSATPLSAMVLLRSADDRAATGFAQADFEAQMSVGSATIKASGPGTLELELTAPAGSGDDEADLRILYQGSEFLARRIPIGVDATSAVVGVDVRGGCALPASRPASISRAWAFFLLLLGAALRRRAANSAKLRASSNKLRAH